MSATRSAVMSLYRRALNTSLHWTVRRDLWRVQALNIRDMFEANRDVTDPRQLSKLLQETEKTLQKWKHPDPYVAPTAPGGSKYERNMPAPFFTPPPKEMVDAL
ncbi:NADH dehydrogenase 1 beta subcomplex subunit 9 [Tricharina praecox]|uniref:NADH dehydrogenase 1 beta subcomplex subunit 9 n=1 Tax=Tricharina praecox TaxID=43433 RepID=UPI0022202919|nr:NADH dehydrogenase 1 beta subcomplex subunit 9 [Tricharina praecox]KAI5858101.1 NADH dehydrogenase 1 beta subcomplex subunit 9 [Tricharina praecox]